MRKALSRGIPRRRPVTFAVLAAEEGVGFGVVRDFLVRWIEAEGAADAGRNIREVAERARSMMHLDLRGERAGAADAGEKILMMSGQIDALRWKIFDQLVF